MTRIAPRAAEKLLTDEGGNTLMLIAGMFLPLLAMVGSGIDISRAYLTKTRLQAACDAGVLAARKTQTGKTMTTQSREAGERYFKVNYGNGAFGSYDISYELASQNDGTVSGVAKATLNTGVMQVFGHDKFALSVDCSAIRDLSDTDVMFVLDTTGSMLETNPGDASNRFETMKTAVADFHAMLESSKAGDVSLRYGFVPYAEMVNVGGLLPTDMLASRWTYQSRVPDGVSTSKSKRSYQRNWEQVGGAAPTQTTSTFPATVTHNPGTKGGEFGGGSGPSTHYGCPTPGDSISVTDKQIIEERSEAFAGPPAGVREIQKIRETWKGKDYEAQYDGSQCVMTTTQYHDTIYQYEWVTEPTEETTYNWHYRPVEYSLSGLVAAGIGGTIEAPIADKHGNRTVTWTGCIEERDTVRQSEFSPIPGDAYDLDIDMKPDGRTETQWRPALPDLIFRRGNVAEERTSHNHANLADSWGGAFKLCPTPSQRLSPMTAMEVELYLDSLVAQGGTHHDIGMLWGARLISPSGIFSGSNSGPQSRHIIFMTDGQIETNVYRQDSYGYPWLDRRRQQFPANDPTDGEHDELVEKRFLAICESARARGLTIWSIAFGTKLSPAMEACSGTNRAFEADNSDELAQAFREIAGGIAKLRLTK
jgi:Flp pilus assembly protein TadG